MNLGFVSACGENGCFVADIANVCPGESRGECCKTTRINLDLVDC